MPEVRWLPSSNLAKLHAVPGGARTRRVKPLNRTLPAYYVVVAVCGREIELGISEVIGHIERCGHCVKAVGDG